MKIVLKRRVVMVNLSDFVDVPPTNKGTHIQDTPTERSIPDVPDENKIIIKKGILFAEVWDLACHTRKTHPNEPVEWFTDGKSGEENTYTLFRIVTNGN
jgi:hypothetical protein